MNIKETFNQMKDEVLGYYEKAQIVLTQDEKDRIELADMGLHDIRNTGLQLITYVNTDRVCAKEMVLLPYQTCPEHIHPTKNDSLGKEETFRCRMGKVYLYIDGEPTPEPHATAPKGTEQYYTVWHEIELNPGEQYTLKPDTIHWFQTGDKGAVISEFSTTSRDDTDIFTNPNIIRNSEWNNG
jgi:D-lyxose ketol-isomerase